jgi:ectoine hydroxylase-related dioxygenase (phytanoyl-CoA dioxygenase family)
MLSPEGLRSHIRRIREQGFTILEGVIAPDLAKDLLVDLDRIVAEQKIRPADNAFEGTDTLRVYNLLVHGRLWEQVPVHPAVLPLAEAVLDTGLLVSSLSSIDIRPGESAQLIHADDQLIPLDKPHRPLVCNTMWALTDFTEANGATRLVPGSHSADCNPDPRERYDTIAAEMPAGSVLVWNGSMWHGGGANASGERRVGIAMNYCAGFIRQQENQQLGVPAEIARRFPKRLKRLCGYGIYNGLIGHIEKRDPVEQLGESEDGPVIWDR